MADVLIVDDEPDIRTLLSDILTDEGHDTRMADTADAALSEINTRRPDLIILDIWLQGSRMDGIEVLKNVKRDNRDVPVLIISGHGNIEVAVAAIRQGAYDFIEKPFKLDHLLVAVARALEASKLRREVADLKSREQREIDLIGRSQPMGQLRSSLHARRAHRQPSDVQRTFRLRKGNRCAVPARQLESAPTAPSWW